MRAPTGRVGLVLSQLDGAWPLREALGARFSAVLDLVKQRIAQEAARHGAYEARAEGDIAVHVFASPLAALKFALDVQVAMHRPGWPADLEEGPLARIAGTSADGAFHGPRLAMGVHVGEAEPDGLGDRRGYEGPAAEHARAVAAAAHGGQVLLSEAAWQAARSALEGLPVVDWGRHVLPGFERREHLRSVVPVALSGRIFPRPRTPDGRRTNLPAAASPFLGREQELADLHARMRSGGLVTVCGPEGVGRTRLVVRFGATRLAEWPGGVWYADLSVARDARGVCAAVAAALGLPLHVGDLTAQVGQALAGRGRLLLILDDASPGAGHNVTAWRKRAPQAGFLAVSKRALGLPGEQIVRLGPLPVPEAITSPRRIAESPAVRLFLACAAEVRPDPPLAASPVVAGIVRRLEGMPLAIQLAAARLQVSTPEELLAALDGTVDDDASTHRRLQSTVAASWAGLAPWDRAALAQSTVFVRGFGLVAAEAVLDLRAWPGVSPWEVVRGLASRSLLRAWEPPEAAGDVRYEVYGPVREHAAQQLDDEARLAAEERHGRCYARMGAPAERDALDAHGSARRWADLSLERPNLEAALLKALERNDPKTAAGCWLALSHLYLHRGPIETGAAFGARVAALDLDDETRSEVLRAQGQVLRFAGHPESARTAMEASLALGRACGDAWLIGRALGALGAVEMEHAGVERAEVCFVEALDAMRRCGDLRAEAVTLGNLGVVRREAGRLVEAEAALERSIALARALGFERQEGFALGHLGEVHRRRGARDRARDAFEAALAIHEALGHRRLEATMLGGLADLARGEGDLDRAQVIFEEALRIVREVGSVRHEGTLLGALGELHASRDRFVEAAACYEAALAIARATRSKALEGQLLTLTGALRAGTGDLSGARDAFAAGIVLLREGGRAPQLAVALAQSAEVALRLGDREGAAVALAEAERQAPVADADSDLAAALARARAAVSRAGPP